MAQAGRARHGSPDRRRRLLRGRIDGSGVLPRRRCVYRGRRQFRGTGRALLLTLCAAGGDAGARQGAGRDHVAVPDRRDRAHPGTDWLEGVVARDERGFILTGPSLIRDGKSPQSWTLERDPSLLETNVPGVFAVGDVRHGSVKRVASSVGEGSIAIQFVHQYLSKA